MILSLLKAFLVLSVGFFSLADSLTSYTTKSNQGDGFTWNATAHHHGHSLGQVRPIERPATAAAPAAHGHHYTPGQHRPVLTHATESTTESMSLGARQHNPPLTYPSYAPFINDLNATATTLTRRTGVRSISSTVAYSFPSVTTTGAVSSAPDYHSVTIAVTQKSPPAAQSSPAAGMITTKVVTSTTNAPTILPTTVTIDNSPASRANSWATAFASVTAATAASGMVSPQPEKPTGPPWTLPDCKGPSPGPGLTPVGCTLVSSSSTTPLPTTTYSWSEFNSNTATSKVVMPSSPQAATSALTSSPLSGNHSQSWTSDSTPCADNKDFECVVNGSNTITLGLISQILGLGAATSTPSSIPHSQNWTANSTPCADNKSFECVDTGSGVITLGPIASLKYSQISTSNSTPCADNKSFECVVNGSSTITLGPIASLTAHPSSSTNNWSTNTGLISTILSELGLLGDSSTTMSSGTAPQSNMPTAPASRPVLPWPTPCASNTSLECLIQGTQTFVVGSLGLPLQTAPHSGVPCAQDTTLECVVHGNRTFTVGKILPKTSSSSNSDSSTTTVTMTPPPAISSSSIPPPHYPYPYPRASNGSVKRFKIPTFLILICSLISMVASIDIRSNSDLAGRSDSEALSSTSTDINYGPLVSSLSAILDGSTVPADGNWGIGVPPATTSTAPATIVTLSAPPGDGSYGHPGKSTSPDAIPASTTLTHAVSGASSSFSPFPTNFIQPVTGSGTEALETTSSPPASLNTAKSGSAKLRIPGLFFLLSFIFLHVAATGVPTPTLHSGTRSGSTLERSTITVAPISLRQDSPPDPLRSDYLGTTTIHVHPTSNGSSKLKAPLLLLFLGSLISLGAARITPAPRGALFPSPCAGHTDMSSCEVVGGVTMTFTPTPDSSTYAASTLVITQSATETVISSRPHGPIPILSGPGPCPSNASLECIVRGGSTLTVATLSPQGTGSAPIPADPIPCASNTSLICIVQGGKTHTVGTGSPQSTLMTATVTTDGPPAATSKPAKSGASNVKIPFFLLPLCSLASLATASINPSPRGLLSPGDIPTTSTIEIVSPGSPHGDSTTPPDPTPHPPGPTLNPLPDPSPCPSNPKFECIIYEGTTITVGTASPPTTLRTLPGNSITSVSPTETSLSSPICNSALSKTATSGSSRVKTPSFLLVLHSFFANSWANLFSTSPSAEGKNAKLVAMSIRNGKFESMTISLPPTTASFSLSKQVAVSAIVVVQSSVVTVVESAETTSQGLRRIATPFLVLIICCAAATLYSMGSGRKHGKKRDDRDGYDSGWVVQREEYVGSEGQERKAH